MRHDGARVEVAVQQRLLPLEEQLLEALRGRDALGVGVQSDCVGVELRARVAVHEGRVVGVGEHNLFRELAHARVGEPRGGLPEGGV